MAQTGSYIDSTRIIQLLQIIGGDVRQHEYRTVLTVSRRTPELFEKGHTAGFEIDHVSHVIDVAEHIEITKTDDILPPEGVRDRIGQGASLGFRIGGVHASISSLWVIPKISRYREITMELFTRTQGKGPHLVLLHGLFGSNENLGSIARALADDFTVHAMDLRNHGRSPHAPEMSYSVLAHDVLETFNAAGIERASILGHSLGGKTAMELALSHPHYVERLIVADIAPITYERRHDQELEALSALDLERIHSRKEADEALAEAIPNPAIRQFLLKNLVRTGNGLAWRIPLDTIHNEYESIAAAPASPGPYEGLALFIRGGNSDYITKDREPAIRQRFPNSRIETIPDAAHWVHVDAPEASLELIRRFLQ